MHTYLLFQRIWFVSAVTFIIQSTRSAKARCRGSNTKNIWDYLSYNEWMKWIFVQYNMFWPSHKKQPFLIQFIYYFSEECSEVSTFCSRSPRKTPWLPFFSSLKLRIREELCLKNGLYCLKFWSKVTHMYDPIISVEVQQLTNCVTLKILRIEKEYTLYINKTSTKYNKSVVFFYK